MISLNDHVTPGNPIINSSANQTIYPRSAPSYFLDINSHDKLCGLAYFWILCLLLLPSLEKEARSNDDMSENIFLARQSPRGFDSDLASLCAFQNFERY